MNPEATSAAAAVARRYQQRGAAALVAGAPTLLGLPADAAAAAEVASNPSRPGVK